jgi:branched-chain amino acid transport system substrate-binding protein
MDGALVLGFMGPLVGEYMSVGEPIVHGAELAVIEINTDIGGIPGVPGAPPRNIVLVECHDLDDPIGVANHLVKDVGVPAIIGPAFSSVLIDVATQVTIPSGILLMSASATSPAITSIPGKDGLVWRTAPSDAIQAVPLAYLASRTETTVRMQQAIPAGYPIRVAMSVKGDAYGMGLADAVTPQLTFNGIAATANGANFLRADYPDPDTTQNVDFASVVSEIVAQSPHIVIGLGTSEVVTKILEGVEASWPTGPTSQARPHWILPDGGRQTDLTEYIGNITNAAGEDLRKRIVGTVPGHDNALNDAFALRYEGEFRVAPGTYSNNAYDAAYLLGYALIAAGQTPIDGAAIAGGLAKTVPPGVSVDVGPDGLAVGVPALQGGMSIDFNGASGPLDFDLMTGDAPADISVWCVGRDAAEDAEFIDSGLYYDGQTPTLLGIDICH